jgi:hypothetical protein
LWLLCALLISFLFTLYQCLKFYQPRFVMQKSDNVLHYLKLTFTHFFRRPSLFVGQNVISIFLPKWNFFITSTICFNVIRRLLWFCVPIHEEICHLFSSLMSSPQWMPHPCLLVHDKETNLGRAICYIRTDPTRGWCTPIHYLQFDDGSHRPCRFLGGTALILLWHVYSYSAGLFFSAWWVVFSLEKRLLPATCCYRFKRAFKLIFYTTVKIMSANRKRGCFFSSDPQ